MQTQVFHVPDVSCEHCRRAITESVSRLGGVERVDVDLVGKRVTVRFDPGRTDPGAIRTAIEDAGYRVAE